MEVNILYFKENHENKMDYKNLFGEDYSKQLMMRRSPEERFP